VHSRHISDQSHAAAGQPEATLKSAMKMHLDQTLDEATDQLKAITPPASKTTTTS
jgi:hypothetical protein